MKTYTVTVESITALRLMPEEKVMKITLHSDEEIESITLFVYSDNKGRTKVFK